MQSPFFHVTRPFGRKNNALTAFKNKLLQQTNKFAYYFSYLATQKNNSL